MAHSYSPEQRRFWLDSGRKIYEFATEEEYDSLSETLRTLYQPYRFLSRLDQRQVRYRYQLRDSLRSKDELTWVPRSLYSVSTRGSRDTVLEYIYILSPTKSQFENFEYTVDE